MTTSVSRVAVTGAAGYVAGGLLRRLDRDETIERVLAIDNRPLSRPCSSKVVFRQHDVTEPIVEMLRDNEIEAVVHLAFVLKSGHDSSHSQEVNIGGSLNVFMACAEADVRHVLYLSSSTIYGAWPDNPRLLTEESPARPVRGFGYSHDKVASEMLLEALRRRKPDCTTTALRACPVMGPNADNFVSRAFSKPFLVGVGGYDPPMQFVHEDDLSEIMYRCLVRRIGGTFNVAGDDTIRWSEMAAMLGRRLVWLPASLLYGVTGLAWALRLQSDSPPCGLDFIRYPWNVNTDKIKRELGLGFQYSSPQAWEAFARRQQAPTKDRSAE